VNVKAVLFAAERRWDNERLPINDKADVAKECFIKNSVGRISVVNAAVRLADDTCPLGGGLRFRHGLSSGQAPRMGEGRVYIEIGAG
jgi:hypothetical protein